ncbi:MAG: glycerophosphodiester phosphodiesterase family protein [Sutterellaceae bacterium]|nr:glycerophosphodiester phosphodiesterase [Burkholderiaceae bacterium]MCX7902030.1 glycerophosphodiester phosphodiesterase family protein [Burkholderiaceae bacterium]MDW8430939.1 glycerophosphodiester phosphodiesterase family protein [Sutterellaceae bacterium]
MRNTQSAARTLAAALALCAAAAVGAHDIEAARSGRHPIDVQVGVRPFYLLDGLEDGPLKRRLQQCRRGPFERSNFSIGHRGAPLQFPEHTLESYVAAARQGAGIVECDVTFTRDGHLVCRHAENDLHTTTNILVTPLAATCVRPFTPAVIDANGNVVTPASAECRTSALTLAEFKSLTGKMDAFNRAARTPQEYLGGTAAWRTDLYTGRGTLLSLRESIELNQRLGVKHTPELKPGDPATIAQVFGSQRNYALKLAEELRAAGVRPRDAWPQSFNVEDVLVWVSETEYGQQAVYLLDWDPERRDIVIQPPYDRMPRAEFFRMLRQRGVRIVAPPIPALLTVAGDRLVASPLARDLKAWGFKIITWTIERSDVRFGAARAGYYYAFDPAGVVVKRDSDLFKVLDVLAREVGIEAIFSDWPETVTFYANCMGLK